MIVGRPVEKSSAAAAADADRLTDLFWRSERTPSVGEWRVRFEATVLTVMRIRNLPRLEAERAAYQNILVNFRNDAMPAGSDPNSCLWCRKPEEPGHVLIPLGYGGRIAWLHRLNCSDRWRQQRRAGAIKTLAEMGLVQPVDEPPRVKP